MQAYNELLSQFHSEQASVLEEDSHIQYMQLLNQLRNDKQKKVQTRKKIVYQSSRRKTQTSQIMKQSYLQKSLNFSRIQKVDDHFKEKRSLIELETQSLKQQINQIRAAFQKLKVEKQLVEEEIRIIDRKEIQISTAVVQSQNNLQELKTLIKQQKLSNQNEFQTYDLKISEMTDKLQKINEDNVLNSKYYKDLTTSKTETKNKSLIGTILMWQSEESKLKQLPKKIYTKNQIQSMLRALFLINKLSELNYGNIIEHLIKITDPNDPKIVQAKTQKKIFTNSQGQQIQISQLVERLQNQLLTPNECKFLSKTKIIEFYAKKGIVISSDWDPNNLSEQTVQLIRKVVAHFEKLTSWFSRIEKRNLQLSQNFRTLQKVEQQLSQQIQSIESSAEQKSINYLQTREQEIQHLHQKLNQACKVIFLLNINMYDLIRRFQNLNKFFDKIVKSTNRKTYRKTFIQNQEDTEFLKKIHKVLFKSPQCIILDWNNVIKRVKTQSSFISTGDRFELMPQNDMYYETIMNNDLLRIYAQPSRFQKDNSYIQNLSNTFEYVISQQSQIIKRLCSILEDLLMFSKNGIEEFQGYREQRKQQKIKKIVHEHKQTNDKLNPLLKLLQQTDAKLDRFFTQDAIKEQEQEKPQKQQQEGFCVESNQFYRRDNYKLIQKLEKLNLKKKGLLPTVPFAVNTSLELQPFTKTITDVSYERDTSRFGSTRNSYRKRQPRLSHQLLSTSRHNVLSERREFQNSRKKDLKDLLKNISNIASENQKYRIRKKLNSPDQTSSMSVSRLTINNTRI